MEGALMKKNIILLVLIFIGNVLFAQFMTVSFGWDFVKSEPKIGLQLEKRLQAWGDDTYGIGGYLYINFTKSQGTVLDMGAQAAYRWFNSELGVYLPLIIRLGCFNPIYKPHLGLSVSAGGELNIDEKGVIPLLVTLSMNPKTGVSIEGGGGMDMSVSTRNTVNF
jgi:hypothetical protein